MSLWRRARRRQLDVDLVVVGSGPAHLVTAINAAAQGLRTVVLESSSYIGGAWAAVPVFGDDVHRYEIVPHHLSPYLDAYAMLEDVGIDLVHRPIHVWDHAALSPESRAWYERNYPESFPVAEDRGARLVHEDQWYAHQDWLVEERRADIEYYKGFHRDVNANVRYFAGGVQALIDRLRDRLRQTGCSVMTQCCVERVQLASGRAIATTSGIDFAADRVLLGQHYSGELNIKGLPGEPAQTNTFSSLMAQVRLESPQPVRYVNVKEDRGELFGPMSYLQLTRSQVPILGEEVATYCIGGSFGVDHEPDKTAEVVLGRMAKIGILRGDYDIWDARWQRVEVASHTREFCAAVTERSGGRIEMSHVAALGQEMSERLDEWRRAATLTAP